MIFSFIGGVAIPFHVIMGYTKGETMLDEVMDSVDFIEWYHNASEDEKYLIEKVEEYGFNFFDDMLFRSGSCSSELTKLTITDKDGNVYEEEMAVPDELKFLDYTTNFLFKVEELDDCIAYYDHEEKTLCVSPEALRNGTTILHEMIHLHEHVINDLPLYFHDTLYWALYKKLKNQIPKLDEIINEHAHIWNGSKIYELGGLHDTLFLLKSLDLDIRNGFKLGTVFAYGREDIIDDICKNP